MNISYRRVNQSAYMVISGDEAREISGFEEEMLKNNDIPSLLCFHALEQDGERQYWYNITSMLSLRDVAEQEDFNVYMFASLIRELGEAYNKLERFLISPEHIVLSEDTVFIKKENSYFEVFLCYYPSLKEDMQSSFSGLLEFFTDVAGEEDEDFIELLYTLYDMSLTPDFTMKTACELAEEYDGARQIIKSTVSIGEEQDEEGMLKEDIGSADEDYEYEDYYEEEPEPEKKGILAKLIGFFKGNKGRKDEEEFEPKDFAEDPVYEPEADEDIATPTVLLSEDRDSCYGKLVYQGDKDEDDYEITGTNFNLGGRDRANDAVLKSPAVSRHHARITKKKNRFFIEDLNSTNGTFLNGKPLNYHEPVELKYMDKIRFADVVYQMV